MRSGSINGGWLVAIGLGVACVQAQGAEILRIGTEDGSFTEFARNVAEPGAVMYHVGRSSPGTDWPHYQPGSFDAQVGRSTMQRDWVDIKPGAEPSPFQIRFDLAAIPRGTFTLRLNAIVRQRRPASPLLVLKVNSKRAGSYRLEPHPAPQLWWPNGGEAQGNTQYFGYESLELQLPAALFAAGPNTLSIACQDGFGFYYDNLVLSNDPERRPEQVMNAVVSPTVLYKQRAQGLVELARVRIRTTAPLGRAKLKAVVGSAVVETIVEQRQPGDIEAVIEVPAVDGPVPVALYLGASRTPIYEGVFTPKRRWQVFALPAEQADFGYNDLPARTLEWENRFIDRTLQIQKRHPEYAFTLDAAANLESYLSTRDVGHGRELLEHLRSGKWGINALYANSFTGLATPEELYRMLDVSLRARREHGLVIDSASQTDEPSVTWALPQVLSDAGIRYFVNGSDPIRGALNPIGHLNFHSPFYWEAASGAKVLVWSGVSYTAIDDMTWAGWNLESARSGTYSPSTLGLTRSLPLFLSQYERDDFPFDAVLLFGLHNDEIPMRHWGDADVIELWNREYAYPKLIPATQRDFFGHILANFPNRIRTYRGDAGAYWEDEAGADARTAAIIRTSQSQLAAAEKFESIARWLQPHLAFDRSQFDAAWKNVLLADSYVWSDANSFRRPDSHRTRAGEAAHRAWAEAALQQSGDLRLTAMDKIADQVDTTKQGVVVLNAESWPRADFFDTELERDEVLTDPETGRLVPCGVLRAFEEYGAVRCWAANAPALGYKFYAAEKGKVAQGVEVVLDPAAPKISNEHYVLEIDPRTGAVAHLLDKSTGLDLVDANSGYGLNEYLYVSGGDPGNFLPGEPNDNRILAADVTLPLPKLQIHRAALTAPPSARRFPWGAVLTIRARAQNTPEIVSTITLLDFRKQINIQNDVEKISTLAKEGVYFAFPFKLSTPRMKYQGATAWVDPVTDMLPGANRQWFATQGGVWGQGAEVGVAWSSVDAPLVTLQDINRGLWPESIEIRNGTLFSYVMNNYWYTDTPAQQGGRFTFRYALTSGAEISGAQAMALTSEQRSPLPALRRYSMGWDAKLPDAGGGFLQATPAAVTVLAIRPLESGDAYLVRVQNMNASEVSARLRFPTIELREAYLGSVMGERVGEVASTAREVTLAMGRYEIKNVVIRVSEPRQGRLTVLPEVRPALRAGSTADRSPRSPRRDRLP
ncbi:MAG: polysaccharide lyase family protein [Gammaproteobacteria bacterium]